MDTAANRVKQGARPRETLWFEPGLSNPGHFETENSQRLMRRAYTAAVFDMFSPQKQIDYGLQGNLFGDSVRCFFDPMHILRMNFTCIDRPSIPLNEKEISRA